jgi:hypothetical protein
MKFSTTAYKIIADAAVVTRRGFDGSAEVYAITVVLDTPSANLRFDADASTVDAESAATTVLDLARYVRRNRVRHALRLHRA